MGSGASTQKYNTVAELNEALLTEPVFEDIAHRNGVSSEVVSVLDKRFKQLDVSETGKLTMRDMESLPGYSDNPVVEKVFRNGFARKAGAVELSFDQFVAPTHAFGPRSTLHSKLGWVFEVMSERKGHLSWEQLEEVAQIVGVTLDPDTGFSAMFTDDHPKVSESEFIEYMLKSMTDQEARVIFDVNIHGEVPP